MHFFTRGRVAKQCSRGSNRSFLDTALYINILPNILNATSAQNKHCGTWLMSIKVICLAVSLCQISRGVLWKIPTFSPVDIITRLGK